jgi:hypothetical protein
MPKKKISIFVHCLQTSSRPPIASLVVAKTGSRLRAKVMFFMTIHEVPGSCRTVRIARPTLLLFNMVPAKAKQRCQFLLQSLNVGEWMGPLSLMLLSEPGLFI